MQSSSSSCPCGDFSSVESIRKALDSEARTKVLVEWLSNENERDTASMVSCCNNHGSQYLLCENRVGSAVLILNAIRDACRYYVVAQSSDSVSLTNNAQISALKISTPTKKPPKPEAYEDAFPSLGGSALPDPSVPTTVLVGKKKVKSKEEEKAKSKRRIRPAPASLSASSPWSTSHSQKGNISRLPSENPLTVPAVQHNVQISKASGIQSNSKKNIRRITPTVLTPQSSGSVRSPWTAAAPPITLSSQKAVPATQNVNDEQKVLKQNIMPAPIQPSVEVKSNVGDQSASKKNVRRITPEIVTSKSTNNIPNSFAASSPPRTKPEFGLVQTPDRAPTIVGANSSIVPSRDAKLPAESTDEQLQNLITVYSTILENHLAPSTALELHLLIRLLTVPKESSNSNEDTFTTFATIFSTGSRCRMFAVGVLKNVRHILKCLGFPIISSLVECLPFRELLPEVTNELRTIVDSRRDASLLADVDKQSSIGGNNKTPILTLPFDQKRDSRHNFRSREEASIYKNREESRDAFLYQLRAFQNFRGRVVDAMQAERALRKIQNASKEVVRGLFTSNMPWFAQVFVELLLQIGLVPMEETDKELLNITDKDRLQKLHRRFSSKEVKTSKSSQKVVLESKNQLGASSATSQPQQHFSGHQEYFFLFIQSADSYNFGTQLKHRLAGMLSKLANIFDVRGLEKRLLEMQMLAKFLGVLVFCPNWEGVYQGVTGSADLALASSMNDLSDLDTAQPPLPLDKYIREGWKKRRLVAVIPWIVEFLRMLRWDNYSRRSQYYSGIFELLRSVHVKHCQKDDTLNDILSSNVQLVSFYLESLFSDVVGLGRISTFRVVSLQEQEEWLFEDTELIQLDGTTPLLFSKPLLFASSPYLEELYALISALKDTGRKPILGASPRKMRPYSIKSEVSSVPGLSLNEGERRNISASQADERSGITREIISDQVNDDEKTTIQRKLVDAFFHQHKDLKEICRFVVDRALKNAAIVLPMVCIIPLLDKGWGKLTIQEENISDLKLTKARISLEEDTVREARTFLKTELKKTISESMSPLCPSSLPKNVIQIAISLAIAHGVELGESMIESLVRVESKKKRDAHARMEKRQLFALSSGKFREDETVSENEAPKMMTDALNKLADSLIEQKWEIGKTSEYVELAESAQKSVIHLTSVTGKSIGDQIPNISTSKLDPCGPCFIFALDFCLAGRLREEGKAWAFAYALLALCVTLAEHGLSHRILKNLASFLAQDRKLEGLILLASVDDLEVLGELLVGLTMKAEVVSMARLEEALIVSCNEMKGGNAIAQVFLQKIQSQTNGYDDANSLLGLRHKLNT